MSVYKPDTNPLEHIIQLGAVYNSQLCQGKTNMVVKYELTHMSDVNYYHNKALDECGIE